jgi:hypothetical protein
MSNANFTSFLEAVRTDSSLRQRLLQVQEQVSVNVRREADAIAAVAAEAGFDLSEWAKRPVDGRPEPAAGEKDDCSATCCFLATSTLY